MPTHPASPGGRSGAGAADRAGALTREHRRLLLVLLIPAFASLLAISSVNVILPVVGSSLRAGAEGLQWVVAGYTLVFGVLLVPAGRAGDLFGRGRLFVVGLVVFGIGSLASGLAPDVVWLNVARLVMGVGSGLFNPQASGMIVQYFDGAARGRAFGLFGAVLGVSVASGPVVGGALIGWLGQDWGWRASLLINVPFVVLGVIAALRLLPASAWAGRQGVRGRADLDPVGAGLLTLGVLLVMLPFAQSAGAAWVWLALPTGCAVLAGWVSWERRYRARGRDPMVDIGLFRQRAFGTGALIGTVFFLGYAPVWLILAQYLQAGLGATALETGLVNIGPALAGAVVAPVAGRHAVRRGRPMVAGGIVVAVLGLASAALLVLAAPPAGAAPWALAVCLTVCGVGQGLVLTPNQTLTLSEVPARSAGAAGGVVQTGQRVATAVGVVAISSVAFSVAGVSGWDAAFTASLGVSIVVLVACLVLAVRDLRAGRAPGGRARL